MSFLVEVRGGRDGTIFQDMLKLYIIKMYLNLIKILRRKSIKFILINIMFCSINFGYNPH